MRTEPVARLGTDGRVRVPELAEKVDREKGDVVAPLAERRNADGQDAEPVEQVGAEPPAGTSSLMLRFVAEITRTSREIVRVPPTLVTSFCSMTRRRRACAAGDISPTSSRNSVPPSALSKLPGRDTASVNPPFSAPNSSDSSRVSASAPQFNAT